MLNKTSPNVILNHKISHEYGEEQRQLYYGFSFFSWIKSKHSGVLYLIRDKRRVECISFFLSLILPFCVFIIFNFTKTPLYISMTSVFALGGLNFLLIRNFRLKRFKKLPSLPLAIINPDKQTMYFYYRKKMACSQIPEKKLQIPFSALTRIDIIRTRTMNDGTNDIQMVIGKAFWKALFLSYQEPGQPKKRDLIFVGIDLGDRICLPIADNSKMPLEENLDPYSFSYLFYNKG